MTRWLSAPTRRAGRVAPLAVALVVLASGCAHSPGLGQDFFTNAGHIEYLAPFHPSDFHHPTQITNPYFPLVTGAGWQWQGEYRNQPYSQTDTVLGYTRTIDGVVTQPVLDTDLVQGQQISHSVDYYAQDDQGNVWYLGEETVHFVNGTQTDQADSWIAGKEGALPGIFMPAHPAPGKPKYQQEYAPNVAADVEHVVSVSETVCVPERCYDHVVDALETTVLSPGIVAAKFYAPGVGLIKEDTLQGDPYSYGLTGLTPGQGGNL